MIRNGSINDKLAAFNKVEAEEMEVTSIKVKETGNQRTKREATTVVISTVYQSYIGILRWAVELGRVDVAHFAGTMAKKFNATPRQGHLTAVVRCMDT
jgi:hypothetical protein